MQEEETRGSVLAGGNQGGRFDVLLPRETRKGIRHEFIQETTMTIMQPTPLRLVLPITLALFLTGCASNQRVPQSDKPVAAAAIAWPGNFRDERPVEEKLTNLKDNTVSSTIVYGDDVDINAKVYLLTRIRQEYPDMLAPHQVVIKKVELMGIFRPEFGPYYSPQGVDPLTAAVAFSLLPMLEEKAVYLNIVGHIDGVEFVGWAHERCKLCSTKGTIEKVMNQALDKTMQSLQKAMAQLGKT